MQKLSHPFLDFFHRYATPGPSDSALILSTFERREVKKNEFLLHEGEICRYFWFLESGLIRFSQYIHSEEITKFFTFAPFCFTSQYSFRKRIPSLENIQAIENSVVWQITLEKADHLQSIEVWRSFTQSFLREVQFYMENLLMESKTETAEVRYLKLLQQYPGMVQRIPLQHLSSFLGIAPQSLSRIRRRALKI